MGGIFIIGSAFLYFLLILSIHQHFLYGDEMIDLRNNGLGTHKGGNIRRKNATSSLLPGHHPERYTRRSHKTNDNMSQNDTSSQSEYPNPAPLTYENRVLVLLLSAHFTRTLAVDRIFSEYQSICEAGWDVNVRVFTFPQQQQYDRVSVFCYRTESIIPVHILLRDRSLGYQLAAESRKTLRSAFMRKSFDVVIYQEDDMIVEHKNLVAHVKEMNTLRSLISDAGVTEYSMGLIRYSNNKPASNSRSQKYDQVLLEVPLFVPVCVQNVPYIRAVGSRLSTFCNIHQGAFILTSYQIAALSKKCGFLSQTWNGTYVREYMSSFSLFENVILPKGTSCGLKKLFPAERLGSFAIQHFGDVQEFRREYPFHPRPEHTIRTVTERLRTGYVQIDQPLIKSALYANLTCWQPVLDKYKQQQNLNPHQLRKLDVKKGPSAGDHSEDSDTNNITMTASSPPTTTSKSDTNSNVNKPILLRVKKTVYLIENGSRRMIPSSKVFEKLGYAWSDVQNFEHDAIFNELLLPGPDVTA